VQAAYNRIGQVLNEISESFFENFLRTTDQLLFIQP
jgi:hypothetical protein